jgi:hypothetical protein
MFAWYRGSAVCYVYLDIDTDGDYLTLDALREARWTSRGWTLQELIAPSHVQFYTKYWQFVGDRRSFAGALSEATSIDIELLAGGRSSRPKLSQYSIAQRMSWASARETTRPEDLVYCLLGLFSVQMPLLYGEGQQSAFSRLQEEILKRSMDLSILAWTPLPQESDLLSGLARCPANFRFCSDLTAVDSTGEPFRITNKGLHITLSLVAVEFPSDGSRKAVIAVLQNCSFRYVLGRSIGIWLVRPNAHETKNKEQVFYRASSSLWVGSSQPFTLEADLLARAVPTPIYLSMNDSLASSRATPSRYRFMCRRRNLHADLQQDIVIRGPPLGSWDAQKYILQLPAGVDPCIKIHALISIVDNGVARPVLKIVVIPSPEDKTVFSTYHTHKLGLFSLDTSPSWKTRRFPKMGRFVARNQQVRVRVGLAKWSAASTGAGVVKVYVAFHGYSRTVIE